MFSSTNGFLIYNCFNELKTIDIFATGTFHYNRIGNCPLLSEKELKSQGRGSWDYWVDQKLGVHWVKWFNNKAVTLRLMYAGVAASTKVTKFDSKKVYVDVTAILRSLKRNNYFRKDLFHR